MDNFSFRFCGVLLIAVTMMVGCKPPQEESGEGLDPLRPVEGGTIRISQPSDPDGLHPYNAIMGPANNIKEAIFMYLYNYNPQTLELEPTLAATLPERSADGLDYTIEIRPEAKWDNGDPITGEDFLFSLKCAINPLGNSPQLRGNYAVMDDIILDPKNPRKFTIKTKEPYFMTLPFISSLEVISHAFYDSLHVMQGRSLAQLRDPEIAHETDTALFNFSLRFNGERYSREPAMIYGSGPYRVVDWMAGDHVTLEKKPNWWGNALRGKGSYFQAYAQTLLYKTIRETSTMVAAARNGELDIVHNMTAEEYMAELQDSSGVIARNFNFHTPENFSLGYLGFNCRPGIGRKPVVDDVRVRKAIAHLLDIDDLIEKLWFGLAKKQWGPLSALKPDEYDPRQKWPAFDPAKASALLDEAGWTDSDGDGTRDKLWKGKRIPLEIELIVSSSSNSGQQLSRILKDQAAKVGIVINLDIITSEVLTTRLKARDFDMVFAAWGGYPFPTDLEQVWLSENWANGGSNFFGFGNPTTDSLIMEIKRTVTVEDRKPLYHRFQELWLEELPVITLISFQSRIWMHKRLQNAQPTTIRPGFKPLEYWIPADQQ